MRASLVALLASAAGLALSPAPADTPLRGFFPQSVQAERDLEARFKAMPDPARMRAAMQRLSARPHHVGSPYDKENAEWILNEFKSYGWDAHIENFDVLFPTPVERVVELVAPTQFKASLQETALPGDPTSNQQAEQLPPYNAYSVDGDVTGPLVFVNYGIPADYEELERRGISVKGAIVIARYGGSWRGRRHADVRRRSAHAGRRRDEISEAIDRQGIAYNYKDPRSPDLVRRCSTTARCTGRTDCTGVVARWITYHVSVGRWSRTRSP